MLHHVNLLNWCCREEKCLLAMCWKSWQVSRAGRSARRSRYICMREADLSSLDSHLVPSRPCSSSGRLQYTTWLTARIKWQRLTAYYFISLMRRYCGKIHAVLKLVRGDILTGVLDRVFAIYYTIWPAASMSSHTELDSCELFSN